MKYFVLSLLICLSFSAGLAQAPQPAVPEFEVATIKPSNPNQPGHQFMAQGHQFLTINTTLSDLITYAYSLHARQIVSAPDWAKTEKFDINGKSAGDAQPTDQQWKLMIQRLLADRFALTFHHDQREIPVFILTVAPGGPKATLKPTEAAPGSLPGSGFRGFGNMPVFNATMADFASMMQGFVLDRPMLDRTGLTGRYDFLLRWTPDDSQFIGMRPPSSGQPSNDPNAPPNLATALQDELGLKLESTRAPVGVLVIDHVDQPSAN